VCTTTTGVNGNDGKPGVKAAVDNDLKISIRFTSLRVSVSSRQQLQQRIWQCQAQFRLKAAVDVKYQENKTKELWSA
jgi:hypothetical protein